jgi:4-hydroxy-3-polyprenylbenzoate decarboxylase
VSKDPFTGKRNIGVYRMKIIDAHHSSISVSSGGHLGRHVRNAERLGKDLQVAVAIGVAEPVVMAAAAALPFGSDEYDFAGALQGESLNLVKCRNTDLEVPSDAEYVLEGIIKYGAKVVDGPYMDYSGKISINPDAFLFEVKSIACKADPIFRGMSVGGPGAEDHQLLSILSHLGLVDFHSSQVRQKMQNFFLKHEFFRLFQYAGRFGGVLKKLR